MPNIHLRYALRKITDNCTFPSTGELLDTRCHICFSDSLNPNADTGPEIPVRLRCGHVFGMTCLLMWINGSSEGRGTCPLCRVVVMQDIPVSVKAVGQQQIIYPRLAAFKEMCAWCEDRFSERQLEYILLFLQVLVYTIGLVLVGRGWVHIVVDIVEPDVMEDPVTGWLYGVNLFCLVLFSGAYIGIGMLWSTAMGQVMQMVTGYDL
ncbi:MAG: hypothetical protein Q9168_005090 [Polycauliona sp. 1 TL-2023]